MPLTRPTADDAVTLVLLAVGGLNLAPGLLAVLPDRIPGAYGVLPDSPAVRLLLRHRAVLLGLVGGSLTVAARVPAMRVPALVGAVVSKVSFLALVGREPPNGRIGRVARADAAALALLAMTASAELLRRCGADGGTATSG